VKSVSNEHPRAAVRAYTLKFGAIGFGESPAAFPVNGVFGNTSSILNSRF